jgi:hypothetical protein
LLYRLTILAGIAACALMGQGYEGPSILSRGSNTVGQRGGEQVDLRFFGNVNGIYDTGLVPVTTDTTGQLALPGGLYGVEAQIGAYGVHNFRRGQIGLDYKGSYRHYTQNSFFDGTDQALTLTYAYQKSRRLAIDTRGVAGTYSSALFANTVAYTGDSVAAGQAIFDNRSNYADAAMDVNFAYTNRTVFSAGGEGFLVTRRSRALIGVHGYSLKGEMEHKLSGTTAIGLTYDHHHYDYPRAFGESNIDGISFTAVKQLDRRRVTIRASFGGLMIQTEGVETVQLDPLVASILGVSTGVQAFYQKSFVPRGELEIRRHFRQSDLALRYRRGVSPGNGVYLTSIQEAASASFDYTSRRRLTLGVNGGWSTYSAIGQIIGKYTQYGGSATAGYKLSRSLQLVASYNARHQDIASSAFSPESTRVQFGVAYSPGDIPLSIR